nr:immunoglobulin heavy chain junction region [Mus musculus]MBK4195665.1 immunoglobulin heavy chain junction region [Mus musculus]MBK4195666.1 immunoglobulin heavy chain junction region [Mus musculus]MBK4195669.1 immunoglobulin heavy chain junction region [Mus musculus]
CARRDYYGSLDYW